MKSVHFSIIRMKIKRYLLLLPHVYILLVYIYIEFVCPSKRYFFKMRNETYIQWYKASFFATFGRTKRAYAEHKHWADSIDFNQMKLGIYVPCGNFVSLTSHVFRIWNFYGLLTNKKTGCVLWRHWL